MDNFGFGDEFFAATSSFGSSPGVIVRRRAIGAPGLDGAGKAWQIIYTTRSTFSTPILASATVIAPATIEIAGPGPVVVYCCAFHGLGGGCAPSQLLAEGAEPEAARISGALHRGWVVAVPDGLGLGFTGVGPHHFLAGSGAAHAVLDLVRATHTLPDLGTAQMPCAVWGYADGGRAAVCAAEIQHRYAPELDLRGIAAGAVVVDPGRMVAAVDGTRWSGLALAGMAGLGRAYSHLPTGHLLTDAGHDALEHACTLDAATLVRTYHGTALRRWCERDDPWNDPLWRYVLATEARTGDIPHVPVHLYHGHEDPLVPADMGRALASRYRSRGVEVSWRDYATGHVGAATGGVDEAIARLTGYLHPHPTRTT